MADAFPNVEQEQINTNIEKKIDNILTNIGTESVYERVLKRLEEPQEINQGLRRWQRDALPLSYARK